MTEFVQRDEQLEAGVVALVGCGRGFPAIQLVSLKPQYRDKLGWCPEIKY